MALLWKIICNLGDPMSLRHPVRGSLDYTSSTHSKRESISIDFSLAYVDVYFNTQSLCIYIHWRTPWNWHPRPTANVSVFEMTLFVCEYMHTACLDVEWPYLNILRSLSLSLSLSPSLFLCLYMYVYRETHYSQHPRHSANQTFKKILIVSTSIPRTEEIRLKMFTSPDRTGFLLDDGDSRLVRQNLFWNFEDSCENLFVIYGDCCETLLRLWHSQWFYVWCPRPWPVYIIE